MSNSVDKSRFSLFVCGGFMDGWSRKTCPRWFTAVCGGRSAGSDGVMHAFLGSVQNGSGTQTSTPKRRHVAAVPAAAENTCRGHTPTCQRPSVFAFLQRIWICGKTSNIHAPSLQMCYTPCSSYDCRCFVSSSVVPVPPLYSREEQLLWIHTRRKQRISTLNRTQWTNDLLTCTRHVTASSHTICLAAVWSQHNLQLNNRHLHVLYPFNHFL